MSNQILVRIGIFAALSMPLAAASAGEIDRVSLSMTLDKLAASYFDRENPGCTLGVIHQGDIE